MSRLSRTEADTKGKIFKFKASLQISLNSRSSCKFQICDGSSKSGKFGFKINLMCSSKFPRISMLV
jgi:hypothetical protein